MNELERIMKKGIITPDFLKEETRCDFFVDEKRKKLWAMQIDLLSVFDEVCKKCNLKYFVIAGSLLGAIRHKGYIPWDDDIDLAMERSDYDRLMEIAEDKFKHPYFLQSAYSDIDYASGHVKLRNSNTVCATRYDFGFEYNKGVFIDIFPLDNLPDDENEKAMLYEEVKKYRRILDVGMRKFYYIGEEMIFEEEKASIKEYLNKKSFKEVYREFENTCSKYKDCKTKEKGCLSFMPEDEKFIWKSEDFKEIIETEYEYIIVPIPKNFDSILKKTYGDYNIHVKGGALHGTLIFEPDVSYKDYIYEE